MRAYVEKKDEGMPMPSEHDETTVVRNDEDGRYEIRVGDVLGGYTEFFVDDQDRLVFPHTVIDPAFRGQGLAGILVKGAMADVAAHGETVVPLCPVVAKFLRTHEVPGLTIEWPHAVPR